MVFLTILCILRSIPDKLLGVIALLGSILILYTLPTIHKTEIKSGLFKPVYQIGFFLFVANSVILSYIGGMPIETPYLEIGRAASIFYFGYFLLIALSGMNSKVKIILKKFKRLSIGGSSLFLISLINSTFSTQNPSKKEVQIRSWFWERLTLVLVALIVAGYIFFRLIRAWIVEPTILTSEQSTQLLVLLALFITALYLLYFLVWPKVKGKIAHMVPTKSQSQDKPNAGVIRSLVNRVTRM
jgi:hypothetical protein